MKTHYILSGENNLSSDRNNKKKSGERTINFFE